MSEQTATIKDTPAQVPTNPSGFAMIPIKFGGRVTQVSREMAADIQKNANGFTVITDEHNKKWKFIIKDGSQTRTYFATPYVYGEDAVAQAAAEEALIAIQSYIL